MNITFIPANERNNSAYDDLAPQSPGRCWYNGPATRHTWQILTVAYYDGLGLCAVCGVIVMPINGMRGVWGAEQI